MPPFFIGAQRREGWYGETATALYKIHIPASFSCIRKGRQPIAKKHPNFFSRLHVHLPATFSLKRKSAGRLAFLCCNTPSLARGPISELRSPKCPLALSHLGRRFCMWTAIALNKNSLGFYSK